jgi:leucyl-tRNA synthetase
MNLELSADASEEEVVATAETAAQKWLEGAVIKKRIFVPKRLVNFVI